MSAAVPRLKIELAPLPAKDRLTTCNLAIFVDGKEAWPVPGESGISVEVQIDDLLAHLTEFWKPLMLRQVFPIDVTPLRPSDFRRLAEQRWAELPPELVEREEEAVSAFEEAHDLSRAFGGLYELPSFWMMRAGDEMVLESSRSLWRLPFEEVRPTLGAVGDEICARLGTAKENRWRAAIEAWGRRNDTDGPGLLAWSAGLAPAVARALIDDGVLEAPRDFDDAANDNDELRIAARMAGALPADQIREIVALARKFKKRDSGKLRALADACADHVFSQFASALPYVQGEAAARFARERVGVANDSAVQIFAVFKDLDVHVRAMGVDPTTLDGLAIWGGRHGPGVFLNRSSGRILPSSFKGELEDSPGARVTLAHELCHLLLDGRHALSAVEVLKARMPAGVEQRAKSFAGEFLLPTAVAAQAWLDAGRPSDRAGIESVVVALANRFGVTWSVAAWKLEHGARRGYDVDLDVILDAVVPQR
jgi:hypothetical protein